MSAVTVDAVVTGHPDGPTVVLSNSLGSDRRMWDAQLPELEKHFRVVRYDTRGHGRSPVPDGAATIDDLADDLTEQKNLIADPAQAERVKRMEKLYREIRASKRSTPAP